MSEEWGQYANSKAYATYDPVVETVVGKLRSRSEVGIKKYGATLDDNNIDDYLNHLQEELLDSVNYIQKQMNIRKHIKEIIDTSIDDNDIGRKVRNWLGIK